MTLKTDIDQLAADAALMHDIIHGAAGATVSTEGGAVKTVAKAVADAEAAIVTGAESYLDQCQAETALATEQAQTATTQAALAAGHALSAASVVAQDLSVIDKTVFAASIVDAIIYDTERDSDGGAWRHRCAHTSWEAETLSGNWLGSAANETAARAISGATTGSYYYDTTAAGFYTLNAGSGKTAAYRGNVRKFPAKALITVEASRVVIWDLTQANAPMWMVFVRSAAYLIHSGTSTSIAMLNGCLVAGSSTQATALNFTSETGWLKTATYAYTSSLNIANRNTTGTLTISGAPVLVNASVNDVAMTVLPNAPVDVATGLPVPTIAVATAVGASVIKDDGTVTSDTAAVNVIGVLFSGKDLYSTVSTSTGYIAICKGVDQKTGSSSDNLKLSSGSDGYYRHNSPLPAFIVASGSNPIYFVKDKSIGINNNGGITRLMENPAVPANGMVAYITKDYNSGWLPGDIRGAWLADTVAETKTGGTDTDRSVKANDLTVNGSLTKAAVASGAQLVGYSGFSVANYLERAYDADFDFGTGDFCIMGWIKEAPNSAAEYILHRGYWNGSAWVGSSIVIYLNASGTLAAQITDDAYVTYDQIASAMAIDDSTWKFVCLIRRGSYLELWINAVKAAADAPITAAAASLSNTSATLSLGRLQSGPQPLTNGTLALWRMSATVPSAEQIEYLYETERPLFEANANCLLAGTSNAITALAYDEDTDLLHVGTSYGRSSFKGLVRVASEATAIGSITALSASAGIIAQGGASGADVYVPAYSLREELAREAEQAAKFGAPLVFKDYDATASQTAFVLPVGYEPVAVYAASGAGSATLQREGSGKQWTRSFDGFAWTATFAAGRSASDWVSIGMRRVS